MFYTEGWSFRDSDFKHNARYKVIALEMKSDPTLFQKQSLREVWSVYMTLTMSKIVQNSKKGIFGYSGVAYDLIMLLNNDDNGV